MRSSLLTLLGAMIATAGCTSLQMVDRDTLVPTDWDGPEYIVTVQQGSNSVEKRGTARKGKVSFGSGFGAIDFGKALTVNIEEVGSEFPNLAVEKYLDLGEDKFAFKKKDLIQDKYILYSNINNDFNDDEIDALESNEFELKQEYSSRGVFLRLYGRVEN